MAEMKGKQNPALALSFILSHSWLKPPGRAAGNTALKGGVNRSTGRTTQPDKSY